MAQVFEAEHGEIVEQLFGTFDSYLAVATSRFECSEEVEAADGLRLFRLLFLLFQEFFLSRSSRIPQICNNFLLYGIKRE